MHKIKKLTLSSSGFPDKLRQIATPPKQLWVQGDSSLLNYTECISIVGSRKLSHYGRVITERFSEELARRGVVIVSGMALGVDAVAHSAALSSRGKTIAVLPSGLAKPYPATNLPIARRILEDGGLLVSEYPPDDAPSRQNFVARNRIVSALGNGVLITEASLKSGTMHTAKFAIEQGRLVMAVPGNITSSLSEGTNNLIRTGAQIVTKLQDVIELLGFKEQTMLKQQVLLGDTSSETVILKLINNGVSEGTELLKQSGLNARDYNQSLTMLEISGRIKPLGADHWGLR